MNDTVVLLAGLIFLSRISNDGKYDKVTAESKEATSIPSGYKKVMYKSYNEYNMQYRDTVKLQIEADSLTTFSFTATEQDLKELKTLHSVDGEALFVPTDYSIMGQNKNYVYFKAEGYLFIN